MFSKNKRLFVILSGLSALLLIPLVAMQFTTEVNWSGGDFIVAGLILLGAGIGVEFVIRTIEDNKKRIILIVVVLTLLVLVWMELAVGLFGISFGGN